VLAIARPGAELAPVAAALEAAGASVERDVTVA